MQRDMMNGERTEQLEKYQRHEGSVWQQSMLLNTADMCVGFYYALLGETQHLPTWLTSWQADEAVVLYPARPCRNFIAAQCLLAQGRYTELLVRYDDLLAECRPYNNFLCQLYLLVQKACAFAGLGTQAKAQTALHKALAMAAPDSLVLPFAQNISLLEPLLMKELAGEQRELVEKILALGARFAAGRKRLCVTGEDKELLAELTEQELQIAQLAAARHTNKEIAAALNLREGTIKQYLNRIFVKLDIDTEAKNKRHQLAKYFPPTN